MLRFTKLEISNFGPYQGTQVIDFPEEDGVVIVWGYNGFGKTTIARAIRFALWGNITDENGNEESIASFVNYDAVERGENMQVALYMNYDSQDYELIRKLERRSGSEGTEDSDYSFEVFLRKGIDIVSTTERDHFLRTAIPEGISRFYLFDGELLQQYESLLKSGNDNTLIKDSIEDILGLPILEISKDSMYLIQKEYSDEYNKVSTADSRTRQAGEKIAKLEEKEDEIKGNIEKLNKELSKVISELGVVDAKLEDTELYRSITQDIKSCDSLIEEWQATIVEEKEKVQDYLDNLWESHLKAVIDAEIEQKESERSTLSGAIMKQSENKTIHNILTQIITEHSSGCNCPICNTFIDDKALSYIKETVSKYSGSIDPEVQQKYSQLDADIRILRGLKCEDNTELIKTALATINKLDTKVQLKLLEKERLEADRRKIGSDSDEKSIESLMPEHDRLTKLKNEYKDGIKAANDQILENRSAIEKIRKQISKNQTSTELDTAEQNLSMCQSVYNLFEEAIDRFKSNLKDNVQRDATKYFTTVAHNSDYKQLMINEEYGLEILTSNGVKVPHRSSGYVQVVAISLIAALHKNAPISGPIVMDSTFQRIDPRHKSNILSSLPELGKQVIVLAYPEEIQANVARNVLQGKLRKEVSLEQVSSFSTIIKQ